MNAGKYKTEKAQKVKYEMLKVIIDNYMVN